MTSLATLVAPLSRAQWFSTMLADAATLGFPATAVAWQTGGVYATLLQQSALGVADNQQLSADLAQGAFLDTAPELAPAGGTSPWLDLLLQGQFQEERLPALSTSGYVTLTTAAGFGPYTYPAGTLIVATGPASSDLRYTNAASVTVPAAGSVSARVVATSPGAAYNVVVGAIRTILTPQPGLTCDNVDLGGGTWIAGSGAQTGADAESDAAAVARAKAKWGTRSAGDATTAVSTGTPQSAYEYWARTASSSVTKVSIYTGLYANDPGRVDVLIAGTSGALPSGVVNAVQAYITGTAGVYIGGKIPETAKCVVTSAANQSITIGGVVYFYSTSDAAAVTSAVNAALAAYQAGRQIGQTVYLSDLYAAIEGSTGVRNCKLTLLDDVAVPFNRVAALSSSLTYTPVAAGS